jgi:hypothetical protein
MKVGASSAFGQFEGGNVAGATDAVNAGRPTVRRGMVPVVLRQMKRQDTRRRKSLACHNVEDGESGCVRETTDSVRVRMGDNSHLLPESP